MSTLASPFGLKPAFSPSGTIRQSVGTIASGFVSDIFQYAPIRLDDDGVIDLAIIGGPIMGAFMGVEWTATDGRRRVGNRWIANEVGTEIVAYYTSDPYLTYEIQADGSVAQANIGDMADIISLIGNTTTGLSAAALEAADLSSAAAQLRVTGVNPGPDNVIGDAFTIVQVQIAEHVFQLAVEVLT